MKTAIQRTGRILGTSLLSMTLALGVAIAQPLPTKKGIAMGGSFDPNGDRLDKLHVGWYYNWTMVPQTSATKTCFVPMYWGKKGQLEKAKQQAPDKMPVLLTFNEPDFPNQSNRTAEEVIQEWPTLQTMAHRISAPTAGRPFDEWMRNYMQKAERNNLRSDFIPVHWYGGPDVENFMGFLERLHKLYNKPLWITEFAVADWHSSKYKTANRFSEDDVVKFMKEVLPRLDRLDYVERYSWLAAETDKESLRPSLLFTDDGKLTKAGLTYAMHGYRKEVTYCGQK